MVIFTVRENSLTFKQTLTILKKCLFLHFIINLNLFYEAQNAKTVLSAVTVNNYNIF